MNDHVEIFLFIDALGWELVSKTAFMADLLPYRREIDMQFGYSSTAIPTILSGRTPAEHGHLGLFRFAPGTSPFRRLGKLAPLLRPKSFWNRGRVRHQLSKLIKKLYGFTGYFQLYLMPFEKLPLMEYCEPDDLFAPHGMGDIANLRDLLIAKQVDYHMSDWHLGDRKNLAAAQQAVFEGKTFLFIYTAELDAILHQTPFPPLSDAVRQKLDWYREQITLLLKTAKDAGKDVRLTVISDHGMTPLTGTADIKGAIEKTGLVFGRDYGACYDSTMLRVTFLKPESEKIIRAAVKPFESCGAWLTAEQEQRYGIYRKDRKFGDAIFLMNPGIQIVPSDMGNFPLNGMHGFAPEDMDSRAAILSTNEIPSHVRRVADYFALMRQRLDEAENGGKQ